MLSATLRYRCANCSQLFTEKEAKCDNWQDPSQSFICPHCEVNLLRVDQTGKSRQKWFDFPKKYWLGLVVFGLGLLLLSRRGGLPPLFPYIATLMVFLGLWISQWFREPPPEETQTVDLIMEKSGQSNVYQFRAPKDDV